jgi:hypothetical protein
MKAPGTPTSPVAAPSGEGCLLLHVHDYAPPSELAASYALWAVAGLAAALALYCLVEAVRRCWFKHSVDWLDGYEAGKRARFPKGGVVTPFPGSPAA